MDRTTSSGNAAAQNMNGFSGLWSGGVQLFWGDSDGPGETLSLHIGDPPEGDYRIFVGLTRAPDFGIFQFFVNGSAAGDPIDLYKAHVRQGPVVDLGVHHLGATDNDMTVEVVGTNPLAAPVIFAIGLHWVLYQEID